MKVGAVDCDEHKDLAGKFGVQGFPMIKIFTGKDSTTYNGERTAKAIAEAGLAAAKKKVKDQLEGGSGSKSSSSGGSKDEVIELTDSNFDKLVLQSDDVWLVEFFAPWCKFSYQFLIAEHHLIEISFKAVTAKTSRQSGRRQPKN